MKPLSSTPVAEPDRIATRNLGSRPVARSSNFCSDPTERTVPGRPRLLAGKVDKALAERTPAVQVVQSGDVCGPDGC